jgi:hypothetical protein
LILGLIIAWVLWPVEVIDTEVKTMRPDLQQDYLAMAIQAFSQNGNAQQAQQRWNELGPDRDQYLQVFRTSPPAGISPEAVGQFGTVVQAAPPGTVVEPGAQEPGAQDGTATPPNSLMTIFVILCLLTLVIGGLAAYLLLFRNRQPALATSRGGTVTTGTGQVVTPVAYEGQVPPIAQYLTTYSLGNDLYDDSFSIDSPSGEFLGECGVGISETIGVGDPKKVTAFEVWLFDKNDIQTVTKVLMSQHAFNDPNVNQRLASKGEPVLAEPNRHIVLETATLQLEARVVNMNYGQGALPANSFFEQLTLELQVWPRG